MSLLPYARLAPSLLVASNPGFTVGWTGHALQHKETALKRTRSTKLPRKVNVLSVRLNDEELADVVALMDTTHKRKSEILKDAFNFYLQKSTGHH